MVLIDVELHKAAKSKMGAFFLMIFLIFITMTSAATEEFSLKQANSSPGCDEYKCITCVSIETGMIS